MNLSQIDEVARTGSLASGEYVAGIVKADPRCAVLINRDGEIWRPIQDFCGGTPMQRRAWCRRMINTLKKSGARNMSVVCHAISARTDDIHPGSLLLDESKGQPRSIRKRSPPLT